MKKTAYDMRISDWSSDVCSSDLQPDIAEDLGEARRARREDDVAGECIAPADADADAVHRGDRRLLEPCDRARDAMQAPDLGHRPGDTGVAHLLYVHACAKGVRSEEHTSELQSLMRISYAVFCLKKKKNTQT